jgi:hypothetical protein
MSVESSGMISNKPHRNLLAWQKTMDQFSNFLSNAIGSLNEIDTQMKLALRLEYLTLVDHNRLHRAVDNCLALTYGLRKSLKNKSVSREKTVSTELSSQPR